jgi:hypothetical protein
MMIGKTDKVKFKLESTSMFCAVEPSLLKDLRADLEKMFNNDTLFWL